MSLKFKWFYEIKRLYLLLSLFVVGCYINNSSTNSDNIASSSPISLSNVTNWTDYLKNITDTPSNFDYSSITEKNNL